MPSKSPPKSHDIQLHEGEELDFANLPVEPDEGLVPASIPDDPEGDRTVDPES
jgi:hypothetical protein